MESYFVFSVNIAISMAENLQKVIKSVEGTTNGREEGKIAIRDE